MVQSICYPAYPGTIGTLLAQFVLLATALIHANTPCFAPNVLQDGAICAFVALGSKMSYLETTIDLSFHF
jgi:hypothetical protein